MISDRKLNNPQYSTLSLNSSCPVNNLKDKVLFTQPQ
ncbi:hypothetical protein SAMN05216596_104325 [Pseudomonas congelans]|jgi:hypothetical protein|uniref:Uncharacterized protein n=1 Tax=Pseudomonas congelans TaxID=200452 RepID=A0A1H0SYS2_9PSED|nr:hypothetical protein SAMN05216596_104325 [Pseudomonas congelans]